MQFHCYIVESISKYLEILENISDNQPKKSNILWYRGQYNGNFKLIPSGLREVHCKHICNKTNMFDEPNNIIYGLRIEEMLNEFKRRANPFLKTIPKNNFEWMFLAQHYGLPTRLLDWTINPLVALYFALKNCAMDNYLDFNEVDSKSFIETGFSDKGSVIFIMNPCEINKCFNHPPFPVDVASEYKKWRHYENPTREGEESAYPICIYSNDIDNRIRAQAGRFTLHGNFTQSIDDYENVGGKIHKILIPYKFSSKIKKELELLGVTDSYIYPGLEGLAKEIKNKELEIFKECKNQENYIVGDK